MQTSWQKMIVASTSVVVVKVVGVWILFKSRAMGLASRLDTRERSQELLGGLGPAPTIEFLLT